MTQQSEQPENQKLLNVTCFIMGGLLAYIAFPTKIETKTVTVEVEKKKTQQNTVIVEKRNKDGSSIKITEIISKIEAESKKDNKVTEVKETYKPQYNVSVMAGVDVTNLKNPITFGIHAQKQFIGPFNLGLFALTNKTVGISAGLQF